MTSAARTSFLRNCSRRDSLRPRKAIPILFPKLTKHTNPHLITKPSRFFAALALLLAAIFPAPAKADVKPAQIFGDHMVLQEGAKLPVWGTADPGEKVTVTFGTSTGSAAAATDGTWRVDLPAVPESTAAQVLTVAGKNTVTFQDVLVGDVWFASGQSNMGFRHRQ